MSNILLTTLAAVSISKAALSEPVKYREFNSGFANFQTSNRPQDRGSYPGFSYLTGIRTRNGPLYVDTQIGLAFPTILTAKTSIGLQYENLRASAGFRPWPLAIGVQVEYGDENLSMLYSYEHWELLDTPTSPESMPSYFMTIGIRWKRK
ncbi:MAG: hypothetical protein CMK59_05040 [Proteobacteria bacterium]|nr:hypothetical protein [Pseudomonadota bacterium]|tara:strand:+ start:89 stop:538 length:450 start_codon:yes stop_codon:yes gene_type:complete